MAAELPPDHSFLGASEVHISTDMQVSTVQNDDVVDASTGRLGSDRSALRVTDSGTKDDADVSLSIADRFALDSPNTSPQKAPSISTPQPVLLETIGSPALFASPVVKNTTRTPKVVDTPSKTTASPLSGIRQRLDRVFNATTFSLKSPPLSSTAPKPDEKVQRGASLKRMPSKLRSPSKSQSAFQPVPKLTPVQRGRSHSGTLAVESTQAVNALKQEEEHASAGKPKKQSVVSSIKRTLTVSLSSLSAQRSPAAALSPRTQETVKRAPSVSRLPVPNGLQRSRTLQLNRSRTMDGDHKG